MSKGRKKGKKKPSQIRLWMYDTPKVRITVRQSGLIRREDEDSTGIAQPGTGHPSRQDSAVPVVGQGPIAGERRPATPFKGLSNVHVKPGQTPGHLAEWETQFPGSGSRPVTDVVIGLDWGTSCTKVAIRVPYAGNRVHFVDFDELGLATSRSLVPSLFHASNSGIVSLRALDGFRPISGFKLDLSGETSHPSRLNDALIHSTAYLAQVLRATRLFFLRQFYGTYRQYAIRWHCNLGIPAAYDDDSALRSRFDRVLGLAWQQSVSKEPITLPRVAAAMELNSRNGSSERSSIHLNVVPEVAAQVVGYARSRRRTEGLHAVVDVGASTLDVATFVLHSKEGDDVYSILLADVKPLGAYQLHRNRIAEVREASKSWFGTALERNGFVEKLKEIDTPLFQVPSSLAPYLPKNAPSGASSRLKSDESFSNQCHKQVINAIRSTRDRRDPNSKKWERGLTVFLTGGGQHVDLYRRVLVACDKAMSLSSRFGGLDVQQLPLPENVSNGTVSPREYHRFSVAYGLSHPFDDIGRIRRPNQIKDVQRQEPVVRYREKRYANEDTKDLM